MSGRGQCNWQFPETTKTVIDEIPVCVLTFAEDKDAHYFIFRVALTMLPAFFNSLKTKRMI
jgi:hypothetical protein